MNGATMIRRWLAPLLLAASSILAGHAAVAADAPRKVIVDDDITGVRSSALLAIQAPDVEVLGLTLVSGSVWRDEGVAHALRMLELAGRTDIPVVPGAIFPLVNTEQATRAADAALTYYERARRHARRAAIYAAVSSGFAVVVIIMTMVHR